MLSLVAQKAQPWLLQPFPMGAPGGVGAQECLGGHGVGQGMAGHGVGQGMNGHGMGQGMNGHGIGQGMNGHGVGGALALPGDTCTWGMFAKFSAGVWRSWAAQAGSVGVSGNGGMQ